MSAPLHDSLVIIPTFNEKDNVEDMVRAIFRLSAEFDVLVVDDNSPDGTGQITQRLQEEFPALHLLKRDKKNGLGTAYISGFTYALKQGYAFIIEMDADFSHPPADLVRLRNTCKNEGFDLAIGSRYVSGVNVVNWPIGRVLMSYGASQYVRFITGMPIRDTTAGFKCYKRKVLETIGMDNIRFVGYAFQIEMKFLAWKYGFSIKEIPIVFTDRIRGTSKMSGKIFQEAVFGVIQMKIRSLFKKYMSP